MQKLALTQEVLTQLTDPQHGAYLLPTGLPTCPTCSAPPEAR